MRTLSMLLALALITFSGCTDPVSPDADPVTGGDGGNNTIDPGAGGGDGSGGNGTQAPGNVAPEANLTADVANGTAPLAVVFTIDGSDADGDNLTWILSVNATEVANGTSVPAQVNHTLEEGAWNVLLVLSDGQESAHANLTIDVVAGGPAPGQTITGSWSLGEPPACGGFYSNPYHVANTNAHEVIHFIADIDQATVGMPFTAVFSDLGPEVQGVHLHFSNPSTIVVEAFAGTGTVTGVVPDGAEKVTFATCGAKGGAVTYEV